MDKLISRHIELLRNTNLKFERYAIDELPWNQRLLGIKGARGVGKTTLLLQYIKKTYGFNESALYIKLDDVYFYDNKLIDLADDFVSRGGKHLFIDEAHKYANWAAELKNIYDYHPDLKVVFTGSSLLQILTANADLSRRALVYTLPGLSFREFLIMKTGQFLPPFPLEDILFDSVRIAVDINDKIIPLKYFDEYLRIGYFPFFNQEKHFFYQRLQEVVNLILEVELPGLRKTGISKVHKLKQLLFIIAGSVPFQPNISALADKTQTSRKVILEYIHHLKDARILMPLYRNSHGVSLLQKPQKIFLENTNYIYLLAEKNANKGNLRETFFLNQLSHGHAVTYAESGDFVVDETYSFEIGGKNKSSRQIKNLDNAFLVSDDIATGTKKRIPLWLFGFMY